MNCVHTKWLGAFLDTEAESLCQEFVRWAARGRVGDVIVLLLQVSSPESSYEADGEAEKAKGEDILKHLGREHVHPMCYAWSK